MKKMVLLFIAVLSLNGCSMLYEQDPRSFATAWEDSQLNVKIAGVSNKEPYSGDLRLNATAYDGNVILMGQSRTAELKSALIEQIRLLDGVKMVYDQIHIKEPIDFSQVAQDSWITTKVKSALMTKTDLVSANIKVITEDAEVFLFGFVTPEQAKNATEIARNINGVERVIQAWF